MSYEKQNWVDHIEDIETGEVFQEGTLFTAKRMNHIEEGIYQGSSQIKENINKISDDKVYVTDFENIQSAIDYAYENNVKNVILEGKTYETDNTIILYEGMRLLGTSKLNTKILKTSNTYSQIKGYNNADIDAIIQIVKKNGQPVDHVKDVCIDNVTLMGNTTPNQYGIYVHNLSLSKLSNIYIEGVVEGIFSFAYMWDSKLSQIRCHKCERGFHIGSSTSLVMENCYASNCKNYGFYLNNFKYSNVLSCACDSVGNREIWSETASQVSYAYFIQKAEGSLFSGLGSEQTNGTCFKIINCKNSTISNTTNLFIKSDYDGSLDDYITSYELDNNNNIAFTNNYFSYIDNGYTGNNNYSKHLKSYVKINNVQVAIENIKIENCMYPEIDLSLTNQIDTRSKFTGYGSIYTDKNIYVATTGNDLTGDGSLENPYKTITYALNSLPRFIESIIQIKIANGTYNEYPVIKNFRGSGILKITTTETENADVKISGSSATKATVRIETNSCNVSIEGVKIYSKTSNGTAMKSELNSGLIEVRNCVLDSWGLGYTGVTSFEAIRSSLVLLDTCTSEFSSVSIKSDYGSTVVKNANGLSGSEITEHGGLIR